MNRLKQRLYTYEDYRYQNHEFHIVTLPDGRLFANTRYPTKLTQKDLPEWYIYGRYYKRWGFLSAKGITDLKYIPNLWINHFLKDDCLLIGYGGKIEPNPEREKDGFLTEKYIGWDKCVYGNEILNILKGAEKYSSFDISCIAEQLKNKERILKEKYPEEFENFHFDVDEWKARPFEPYRPSK